MNTTIPPDDDDTTPKDLVELFSDPLLVDPDRIDLQDPLEILIKKEDAMAVDATTAPGELPPLTLEGMFHTEPTTATGTADKPYVPPALEAQQDKLAHLEAIGATADYIQTVADTILDAVTPDIVKPILTNPMDRIDELDRYDQYAAYFAENGVGTSMGYMVLAGHIKTLRDAHEPQAPEPSIDIFAKFKETFDASRARDEHAEEIGFYALPQFDATQITGVYMGFMYRLFAAIQFSGKWPPTMPSRIVYQIQTGDRGDGLKAAYGQIEMQAIGKNNPAATAILAQKEKRRAARNEANKIAFAHEVEYILRLLQDTPPETLDDDAWESIPLYIQLRFTTIVYNQVVSACGKELDAPAPDIVKIEALAKLAGEMYLEIEATMRTPEVKAAFEQGRLNAKHDVIIKPPKPEPPKQPKMQRAPRPDENVKPDDPHANLDDDTRS
jgi:hypothetical protein